MDQVHYLVGKTDGRCDMKCSFFIPDVPGKSPKPVHIGTSNAQAIFLYVAEQLRVYRASQRSQHILIENEVLEQIREWFSLEVLSEAYGDFVIGTMDKTTAGFVHAGSRLAYIGKQDMENPFVLAHEMTHLAGLGQRDDVTLLLDPQNYRVLHVDMFNSSWRQVHSAPVYFAGNTWLYDKSRFAWKGFFFEEAMAELVELRLFLRMEHTRLPPITFKGKQLVFEIPGEYGQCVAGWSILKLERYCPGIVITLVKGARGNADHDRLRRIISKCFPGLYDELHSVTNDDGLAYGSELILKRIDDNRR